MSNIVKKTIITTVVTAATLAVFGGIGKVGVRVWHLPEVESRLARVEEQTANMRIELVELMIQTGHPPDKATLEKLVLALRDFGRARGELIETARVTPPQGSEARLASWVPKSARVDLSQALSQPAELKDPSAIGDALTAALLSQGPEVWEPTKDGRLVLTSPHGEIVALKPRKGVSYNEMADWISEFDRMKAAVAAAATSTKRSQTQPHS